MRTITDEIAAASVVLEPAAPRAVLAAVLALHTPADPRMFPEVVAAVVSSVIPTDRVDIGELRALWDDRDNLERGLPLSPPLAMETLPRRSLRAAGTHRLELLATVHRRVFGVILERYAESFSAQDCDAAEALQAHLGPAFDHARLRAAERGVAEAITGLTVREQEVLALVADGRTNRDIGLALFIEPRTVEKHVEHIRTKLGARSRAEAAAKWARGLGVPIW